MLRTIQHDAITELRLDRPPVNALGRELLQRLPEALREATEAGAEGIVLSGTPGMFTGGLDIPELIRLDRETMAEVWKSFFAAMRGLATSPVPVAAAITGHSPAGGAVLSLFCDYRIMAKGKYKIGLNEVAVGIRMPRIILGSLERLVGFRHAERLVVSGAMVLPAEAYRIGLIDEIGEDGKVVETAIERLQALLRLPRAAMHFTRARAREPLIELIDRHAENDMKEGLEGWFTDETQAALKALVIKLSGG